MSRGRKADHPDIQALKGNPGKRGAKLARLIEASEERARLIADSGNADDPTIAPHFLLDPLEADSLQIWTRLSALLATRKVTESTDSLALARYCCLSGLWMSAYRDVRLNGTSYKAKTHSGNMMLRENPSVAIMTQLSRLLLDLERRFGLTPADRHDITRHMFGAAAAPTAHQPDLPGMSDAPTDEPGALDALDSQPPGLMN